jgi:hypothetical protein
MPGFGESPQGPLNTFFPKGENAAFGVQSFNVIGSGIFGVRTPAFMAFQSGASTGQVQATGIGSGGVPGITATLIGTGVYSLRFPSTKSVGFIPAVSSSSGYNFQAVVNNVNGVSGSAQLEITRVGAPGQTGFNPIQASGFTGYLPTGTVVNLGVYAAPNNDGVILF